MSTTLAKIISAIFHPLLVPTYALLLIINLKTHSILSLPEEYRYVVVVFVFLTTFVLPSLVIFILLKFGKISSLEMPLQQERVLPMLIVAISFYGTYYLLKQSSITGLMSLFMVGATMTVLITLIINYITKISLHMTAWGGLLGTLLGFAIRFQYNLLIPLTLIILVIGNIAAARLKLNAHSPVQVYAGFFVGTIIMIFLFYMI